MLETKPSYTDLVYQVVRESVEPLPFAEIMRRVNDLLPITTKNPKSTIRNAVSQFDQMIHGMIVGGNGLTSKVVFVRHNKLTIAGGPLPR